MLNRIIYTAVLAFTLLFAQQGAAWHALSHASSTVGHSQPDQKLPHGEQCTKCAAFSQLGAACVSSAPPLVLLSFNAVAPQLAAPEFYRLSPQAYQSRAPPFRV